MITKILVWAVMAVSMVMWATMATTITVNAEPDCEKVGVHDNPAGNAAGNGHECIGGSGDNPEPVRDCSHKNSEKDNNNDGTTACIPRGPVEDDD